MTTLRFRKVLRDLWSQKARTILVVLSISVGVFAVGMIANTQAIITRELSAEYNASNPYHAVVFMDDFDEHIVHIVQLMEEVSQAEGRRSANVNLQVGPDEWLETTLYGVRDFEQVGIARIWWEEGEWPPGRRDVVIERGSLDITNAQLGEILTLETLDGEERELRFSAIAHDIDQVPSSFTAEAVAYVTLETLTLLDEPSQYNMLYVILEGDNLTEEEVDTAITGIRDNLDRRGIETFGHYIPDIGRHWADEVLQAILVILGVLGVFSLLLSGFLVINIISALIVQQTRQIGMMKAVGARGPQVTNIYFSTVLILGFLALSLAVPVGSLGANALSNYLANLLNFDILSYKIPLNVLALQAGIAVVLPLLAALLPVIRGARVTVSEAVSDYGLGKGQFGGNLTDRVLQRVRGVPRPVILSLRNTFRRKGRLTLTLVTLTLGGAMFIAVASVRNALFLELDNLLRYFDYDVDLDFEDPQSFSRIEKNAVEVPGVVSAEAWVVTGSRRLRADGSESNGVFVQAPPHDTQHIDPIIIQGRWLDESDTNAIVLNQDFLRSETDIEIGDEIVLLFGDKEVTFEVVGIAGRALFEGAYANRDYLAEVTGNLGRAARLTIRTDQHDVAYQSQVAKALEEHLRKSGMPVADSDELATVRETNTFQFNILVGLLLIMAIMLIIVGGLGLAGTMSLNVMERTREVGVMRAIGASTGLVMTVVLSEGIVIGVLGWLLGLLASYPLSKGLTSAVGTAFFEGPIIFNYSFLGALTWLGIVLLIAALASLIPASTASRITVREALAYE